MEKLQPSYRLRDYTPSDSSAIYRINDAELPNVTLFREGELPRLADQAIHFRVAESKSGEVDGFVLALDETVDYASLNFQWFKARYPKFIYVDRIVVCASAQGKGVGQLLYTDLAKVAKKTSPLLTCEVNLQPANPDSIRFHEKFGFEQVGTQETEGGKKTVALMAKKLNQSS